MKSNVRPRFWCFFLDYSLLNQQTAAYSSDALNFIVRTLDSPVEGGKVGRF